MAYKSDIEIAQECQLLPIGEIAARAHIDEFLWHLLHIPGIGKLLKSDQNPSDPVRSVSVAYFQKHTNSSIRTARLQLSHTGC